MSDVPSTVAVPWRNTIYSDYQVKRLLKLKSGESYMRVWYDFKKYSVGCENLETGPPVGEDVMKYFYEMRFSDQCCTTKTMWSRLSKFSKILKIKYGLTFLTHFEREYDIIKGYCVAPTVRMLMFDIDKW